MPGLVRGPHSTVLGDHVGEPVAHNQPLVLRFGQNNEPAAFGSRADVRLTARAAPGRNTRSMARNVGVAESCFKRRDAALVGPFIGQTAPRFLHRSRMSSDSAMQMDLRLAHSLSMWTLASVK